jgi:hypothetical protein
VADPRYRKYQQYLKLWLESLKDQWADGQFATEQQNTEAWAKAQFLKDLSEQDYDSIRNFFLSRELIKESEQDEQDPNDEG